ncbi:MAG: MFS transporter [Bacteroidia bacterium]
MKIITRTVLLLSFVSLFTDLASEMLYPVMPVYLKSIGFSVLLIGILEGLAEAVAGLSKGYFGELSDHFGKRLPFVRFGYTLSALSKPMMALFTVPIWIFGARSIDRLGKGIRTSARDALLSDETSKENKAKVFGFHRGMDTFGAVLGPLSALIFLYFFPGEYRTLFLIAFAPGVFAILFTFLIQEKKAEPKENKHTSFFSFIEYFKESPTAYRQLVFGLLAFALFNSSDVFLLLKIKESGMDDTHLIGIYIFYNLVYALSSFPVGILADKIGLKNIFICGLILFAIVYTGMGLINSSVGFLILFFLYGLYAAATEGVSKAWITNIVKKENIATAVGTYSSFNSIFTLVASSLAGLVWYKFGANTIFFTSAAATIFVSIYFSLKKFEEK